MLEEMMITAVKTDRRKKDVLFIEGLALLTLFALIGIQPIGAEPSLPVQANMLPQKKIETIFDRPGEMKSDVLKIGFPRTDLHVTLDGVLLKPSLALNTWVAFKPAGNEAFVLGDIVLKEGEIKQVESKLKERGFEITAIHNHLAGEKPKVMYLHFFGKGNAEQLARNLREALRLTKTPLKLPKDAEPEAAGEGAEAEAKQIDTILGKESTIKNGVIQYGIPRKESITVGGLEVPPSMGLATVMNFQPAKGKTVVTGDFVLIEKEVNKVVQVLRESGIEVTALHNHLLKEEPRLFFVHFWGIGPSTGLASGLKKALEQISSPA
jgi:hypothetical protein